MLYTELHLNQSLQIDNTTITMVVNKRNKVRLSIDAPNDVKIKFEKKDSDHNIKARANENC